MKNKVFIHTNAKQMVGAVASAYSLKRNSRNPDSFDVKITSREDFRFFDDFEGRPLHGTFLIDATGQVRWQNIGYRPFTDLKWLVGEAQRLLTLPPEATGATAAAR